MTFIQLSLLGVPAVIHCMNTLSMKTFWHRETIGYHIAGMDSRLRAEALLEKIREMENSAPVQEEEEKHPVEINLPKREAVQGELF